MPSRRLHNLIPELAAKQLLERLPPEKKDDFLKLVDEVNRVKDEPSAWAGSSHRKYRHGHLENMKVAFETDNPVAAFALGELHDAMDGAFDHVPGPFRKLAEDALYRSLKSRRRR